MQNSLSNVVHIKRPLYSEDLLHHLTPIMFGASSFQYLHAGCELGLFELLNKKGGLTKGQIAQILNLQDRAIDILLLGTSALKLTKIEEGLYSNTSLINEIFEKGIWKIFKDVVAFEQYIVYTAQVDFAESLRNNTNIGLKRIPGANRDLYHRLSENPQLENVFYEYMESWTLLVNHHLFDNFDFSHVNHVLDVGGGTAVNAIALAKRFPKIQVTVLEIPGTGPIARSNIAAAGLSERVHVHECDMFAGEFPKGHDCVLFSHQLVIWTPEENQKLLKKAYDSLPNNGNVVIFSSISNDEGDGPLMAALDSVYFACLPAEGGMIYNWCQYDEWLTSSGFSQIAHKNCYGWTPHGLISAQK